MWNKWSNVPKTSHFLSLQNNYVRKIIQDQTTEFLDSFQQISSINQKFIDVNGQW